MKNFKTKKEAFDEFDKATPEIVEVLKKYGFYACAVVAHGQVDRTHQLMVAVGADPNITPEYQRAQALEASRVLQRVADGEKGRIRRK